MWARVTLQLLDGSRHDLGPGDLLGRMPQAALVLDDARVSEAHAMVSLRGGDLKLLPLRGRFLIDGKPVTDVVLEEGMTIEPAPGLEIVVVEVVLPEAVLAIEGDDLPRQVLTGSSSLCFDPRPRLEGRHARDAVAWLWPVGDAWRLRLGDAPQRAVAAGEAFEVHGQRFRLVAEPLARVSQSDTVGSDLTPLPLRVVARYDSAHIHGEAGATVLFDGVMARIIGELAAMAAPAPWHVVAAEVWPQEEDRAALRRRWDVQLTRIRRRLREAGLRHDLVRSGGAGSVELYLLPDDRLEDQT